ncbi:putative transmembrane protein [Mycobacterium intracellulare 1956]|uniref:Putative transmembrane protein n=1 Tax=Mycobacterium intracellulare 1956 TaxID=1299331 RepID=X8CHY9_MYCIT|nr:putative transmembrane protein [Mycobacterium intracellulare 1956]
MADKPKRPPRFDMKSASGGKSGRLVQIGGTAFVVIFAVVLVFYIVTSNHKKPAATGAGDTVRVTSSKLVTQPGTNNPKAVVTFYEDFLCPACGNFERTFGPTVSRLIDVGPSRPITPWCRSWTARGTTTIRRARPTRPAASPTNPSTPSAVSIPRCSPPTFSPAKPARASRTTRG